MLDLLRHGAAYPSAGGGDDARALSPRGLADLERLASRLAEMGWRPDRAFASPLRRALDSATIALRRAAPQVMVERMAALRPDSEPADVVAALVAAGAVSGNVLLVAHQPLLGRLASHLDHRCAPGFAPGAMVRIEFAGAPAAGQGTAGWRLGPGGVDG